MTELEVSLGFFANANLITCAYLALRSVQYFSDSQIRSLAWAIVLSLLSASYFWARVAGFA